MQVDISRIKVSQTNFLAIQLAEIHNMLECFINPPNVTYVSQVNVMTYYSDFAFEGWRNRPSSAPNSNVITNGTNYLESVLKNLIQETKLQFQAQRETINYLETQVGQIITSLSSWVYEEPKLTDMSEAKIGQPIIVTKIVYLLNPNL